MKVFVSLFMLTCAVIGLVALHSFVAMQLYDWFLREPFELPRLHYLHFYGIMMFAKAILPTEHRSLIKPEYRLNQSEFTLLTEPIIILGIGWVIHLLL